MINLIKYLFNKLFSHEVIYHIVMKLTGISKKFNKLTPRN